MERAWASGTVYISIEEPPEKGDGDTSTKPGEERASRRKLSFLLRRNEL